MKPRSSCPLPAKRPGLAAGGPGDIPMLPGSSETDLGWEGWGVTRRGCNKWKGIFSFVRFQTKQPVSFRLETIVSCSVSHSDPSSALVERNVLKPIPKRCLHRLPDAKI